MVFVQLGKAIQALKPEFRWSVSRNYKSKAKAAFTGSKDGEVRIELLLQPKFPACDLGSNNGFQSISGKREPDIVLTRTDENVPKWYVLDAKYRTKRRNVLEAMTSAHVYRDALALARTEAGVCGAVGPARRWRSLVGAAGFHKSATCGRLRLGPGNQSSKRPSIVDRG